MTTWYVYRWRKFNPALFGLRCRVVAYANPGPRREGEPKPVRNSALVEFAGGTRHVVSRNALRRADPGGK